MQSSAQGSWTSRLPLERQDVTRLCACQRHPICETRPSTPRHAERHSRHRRLHRPWSGSAASADWAVMLSSDGGKPFVASTEHASIVFDHAFVASMTLLLNLKGRCVLSTTKRAVLCFCDRQKIPLVGAAQSTPKVAPKATEQHPSMDMCRQQERLFAGLVWTYCVDNSASSLLIALNRVCVAPESATPLLRRLLHCA